jgi:hypothetical protein
MLVKLLLGGSILFVEYMVMFVIQNQFQSDIVLAYEHLHYSSMRPSVLKYDILFVVE